MRPCFLLKCFACIGSFGNAFVCASCQFDCFSFDSMCCGGFSFVWLIETELSCGVHCYEVPWTENHEDLNADVGDWDCTICKVKECPIDYTEAKKRVQHFSSEDCSTPLIIQTIDIIKLK